MSRAVSWSLITIVFALLVGSLTGCFIYRTVGVEEISVESSPTVVETPLKVHLRDGSVVLFREGATFEEDRIRGAGVQYSLTLEDSVSIDGVAIDSVAAIEAFETQISPARTAGVSTLATVGGLVVFLAYFLIRWAVEDGYL